MAIDGTFKDKLMTALHTAVGYFNQSGDPNGAVVKAASDFNFNVDQTARLIETFNTARTIYHYKSASDRSQSFGLADPAAVIPMMFEVPAEKAASARTYDVADYSEYDRPEFDYQDNMVVKAGGVHDDVKQAEVTQFADTNLDTLGARANKVTRTQRGLAKTARDESNVCGAKASMLLSKLASEMSRGYAEDCESKFARLFGGYASNPLFSPVMDKFAEFVPEQYKVAAATDLVIDDRDLGAEIDLLKEAKSFMEAEAEFLGYASILEKEADAFESEFMGLVMTQLPAAYVKSSSILETLNPMLVKASAGDGKPEKPKGPEPLFQFGPDKASPGYGKPGMFSDILGSSLSEGAKKPITEHVSTGLDKVIFGPTERGNQDLSERLKNVHRQIMLEDLMTNDPVLSDEAPETVANAYQAVLSMAPDLASNKEVVRAILRQSVHSVAISPYEAQSWTDLEKNIRNISGKADSKGMPMKPGAR